MIRRFSILLCLCSVCVASALSQEVQEVVVTASFDTSRVLIGDHVNYTVTVDQPSDMQLNIQLLRDTICKGLEILDGPLADTLDSQGRRQIINKYVVTSFDSGYYYVAPVYAEKVEENGVKRFYSDYSLLEVARVNIAPADTSSVIYDIVPPYKAPLTVGEMLPWLLYAILAAIVIYAIYRLISFLDKSRKKEEVEEEIIREPAHVIAFRELERLKGEELWQKGETKEYYSRLTGIVRQYLDHRYDVNSLELTTAETLSTLVKKGFKRDEQYKKLQKILDFSDLVKFAKHKPSGEENEAHFDESKKFVEATMEKIEEPVTKDDTVTNKEEGKEVKS